MLLLWGLGSGIQLMPLCPTVSSLQEAEQHETYSRLLWDCIFGVQDTMLLMQEGIREGYFLLLTKPHDHLGLPATCPLFEKGHCKLICAYLCWWKKWLQTPQKIIIHYVIINSNTLLWHFNFPVHYPNTNQLTIVCGECQCNDLFVNLAIRAYIPTGHSHLALMI